MPNTNRVKLTSKGDTFLADVVHDNVDDDQKCAEEYTKWKLAIQARAGNLEDYRGTGLVINCDVFGKTYITTEELIGKMTPETRAEHKAEIIRCEKAEKELAKKAA
jgi:hypothetical protein